MVVPILDVQVEKKEWRRWSPPYTVNPKTYYSLKFRVSSSELQIRV